jgi:hypothetical protein
MIHIYNPRPWPSLDALVKAIKELGKDATIVKDRNLPAEISWGFSNANSKLNPKIIGNKLVELQRLKVAGVKVPNILTIMPLEHRELWLERKFNHRGGKDLKRFEKFGFLKHPDYWVERITNVVHEFRIHVFKDKVVRAGLKVANPDNKPHPWIRTHKFGWIIDYGDACQNVIKKSIRVEAKKAVKALGYDFGAVDIALRADGSPLVFEVNAAPGLDNYKTALKYAAHFIKTFEGGV